MRVALVVGEDSGDILGAGLMAEILKRYPDCEFEGIGGERMLEQGFKSLFPQDRLAVMGFVEPLKRLPELLRIRKSLRNHFIKNKPDVFIGIDSPEFNTDLELSLREAGVKTAHYVSPSVWAWRQGRIKKIAKAVDLMLTLFPFEADFYKRHNVPVKFVGHPLADEIPLTPSTLEARQNLGLAEVLIDKQVVALLPGSRSSEVERLGRLFLDAAARCFKENPKLHFILPSANAKRHAQLEALLQDYPNLPVSLIEGQSHSVMCAADFVMMASGTTTLEAMLLKKPMVIAYKVATLSYWIYKMLVKVDMIGLPNLLAGRKLVPEYIQDDATVNALSSEIQKHFDNTESENGLAKEFMQIHQSLKCNASEQAAEAVIELIG